MKQIALLLMGFLLLARSGSAQIIYTDIDPDSTVNTWAYYSLLPAGSSTEHEIRIWFHPFAPNEVVVQNFGECYLLWDEDGIYPAMLSEGDEIGSSGIWRNASYDTLNKGGVVGNWTTDATDKFLGFRYKDAAGWHYGWLKMDIDHTPTKFVIKEEAHQQPVNTAILAGQGVASGLGELTTDAIYLDVKEKKLQVHHLPEGETFQLNVYDISGKQLLSTSINDDTHTDLHACPAGMYIVEVCDKKKSKQFKLLLQ